MGSSIAWFAGVRIFTFSLSTVTSTQWSVAKPRQTKTNATKQKAMANPNIPVVAIFEFILSFPTWHQFLVSYVLHFYVQSFFNYSKCNFLWKRKLSITNVSVLRYVHFFILSALQLRLFFVHCIFIKTFQHSVAWND